MLKFLNLKNHKPKSIHKIISFFLVFSLLFTGMGFCSLSPNHDHDSANGSCLHFHQSVKDLKNNHDFYQDHHQKKQNNNHNANKLHCHTDQIIVCLNDFTVVMTILNYETFFENPLTSLVSHISSSIDHIPI